MFLASNYFWRILRIRSARFSAQSFLLSNLSSLLQTCSRLLTARPRLEGSGGDCPANIMVGSMSYSWFAADVIQLCKLGICHVGAHLKCEISCKYSAISIVPSFKYVVLWVLWVKKIQNHKRIFFLGYPCFWTMQRA